MATSTGTTWLAQLQAEPWFAAVENEFKQAGVQDSVWESTVLTEDSSLDPNVITHEADGSTSVGLFQLNSNGLGKNVPLTTEEDPVGSATIAAAAMAKQIAYDGTQYASAAPQLQSVEKAGWPGNLSQDALRQANLQAISTGTTSGAAAIGNEVASGVTAGLTSGLASLGLPNSTQINTWITNGLIGAVLLALVAGGFTLLAAPAVEKAAPLAAAA